MTGDPRDDLTRFTRIPRPATGVDLGDDHHLTRIIDLYRALHSVPDDHDTDDHDDDQPGGQR